MLDKDSLNINSTETKLLYAIHEDLSHLIEILINGNTNTPIKEENPSVPSLDSMKRSELFKYIKDNIKDAPKGYIKLSNERLRQIIKEGEKNG